MLKKFCSLAVALVLSVMACPQVHAAPIQIKIGSSSPDTLPFVPAFEEMAKFIETKSNGKYEVTIYPMYKLGNISTEMQGLQMGMIHFVHDGSNNTTAFVPIMGVFDLPYIFTNMEQVNHIFSGKFHEHLKEIASTNTLKCLGFANSTFRNMCTISPVKNLEDMRKLKIRVTNSKTHIASIRAMGISVTPMPFTEVYTGLQQGVVEGFDLDYPYTVSSRLYEVAPYTFESNHMYTPQVLYTGTKWWNKLSDEDRAMFEEAVQLWLDKCRTLLEADRDRCKQICVEAGNTITTPDEAEIAKWVNSVASTRDMMTDKQKKLYEEIQTELRTAGLL